MLIPVYNVLRNVVLLFREHEHFPLLRKVMFCLLMLSDLLNRVSTCCFALKSFPVLQNLCKFSKFKQNNTKVFVVLLMATSVMQGCFL